MINPTPLSPAVQEVLNATDYPEGWATRIRLAAAFRVAANQPYDVPVWIRGEAYWPYRNGADAERERFLGIAAELEESLGIESSTVD